MAKSTSPFSIPITLECHIFKLYVCIHAMKRVLRFRNGPFHDVAHVKPDGPCAADVSHSQPIGTRRKKKNLVVTTWDVHTLLDQNSSKSKRPEEDRLWLLRS